MNYKRKFTRRKVHCALCNPWRRMGNSKHRLKHADRKQLQVEHV